MKKISLYLLLSLFIYFSCDAQNKQSHTKNMRDGSGDLTAANPPEENLETTITKKKKPVTEPTTVPPKPQPPKEKPPSAPLEPQVVDEMPENLSNLDTANFFADKDTYIIDVTSIETLREMPTLPLTDDSQLLEGILQTIDNNFISPFYVMTQEQESEEDEEECSRQFNQAVNASLGLETSPDFFTATLDVAQENCEEIIEDELGNLEQKTTSQAQNMSSVNYCWGIDYSSFTNDEIKLDSMLGMTNDDFYRECEEFGTYATQVFTFALDENHPDETGELIDFIDWNVNLHMISGLTESGSMCTYKKTRDEGGKPTGQWQLTQTCTSMEYNDSIAFFAGELFMENQTLKEVRAQGLIFDQSETKRFANAGTMTIIMNEVHEVMVTYNEDDNPSIQYTDLAGNQVTTTFSELDILLNNPE